MVPVQPKQWLDWAEVADCFLGRADRGWEQDRDLIDQELDNPWDDQPGRGEMRAVLDTSVTIAVDVPPLEGELAISAAAVAELHLGVLITADPAVRAERLRRLVVFQRRFTALPIDESVATS